MPPRLTIEGEEGNEENKGKRKTKDESSKTKPQTETEADARPDALPDTDTQRQDNTRKKRKIGEGNRDKDTPVTQTTRVKGLSIKEMLQKMQIRGKRKEQMQRDGTATSGSDAQDTDCNLGREVNIVSHELLNNRGQQTFSDTISSISDFFVNSGPQQNDNDANLSSMKVQQRGRVETGICNQISGGNRDDKRQTVRNEIILDFSKSTDTPEIKIPEEEVNQGLTERTPDLIFESLETEWTEN